MLNNGIDMTMEGFDVFQISEEEYGQAFRSAIEEGYCLIDTGKSVFPVSAAGRKR